MPKNKDVDAWLARYDNPMKDVVLRVREIILEADPRMGECIKWQAPTFTFQGNLASFFPRSKAHASLMFHQGAQIPGDHPRMEGTGDTARMMKFASVVEAEAARKDLERVVAAWINWRSAGTTPPRAKNSGSKPRATARPSAGGAKKKATARAAGGRGTKNKVAGKKR